MTYLGLDDITTLLEFWGSCLAGQSIKKSLWHLPAATSRIRTHDLRVTTSKFLGEIGLYYSMQTVATPELWLAAAAVLLAASPAVPKTFKLVG